MAASGDCRSATPFRIKPRGLAHAFIVGRKFIGNDACVMILGDNIFFGSDLSRLTQAAVRENRGATIFAYPVKDPERFGVVEFDADGRPTAIVEKPKNPTIALRRDRTVRLRQRCRHDRARSRSVRSRRDRDHRPQPAVSRARSPRCQKHGARHGVARHRNARIAAGGESVRSDDRTPAGIEDRVSRGGCLALGLDR